MPRAPVPEPTNAELFPGLKETKVPLVSTETVVDVAVPVPVDRPFTYLLPDEMKGQVDVGSRVAVSFSNQRLLGVVIEVRARREEDFARLAPVQAVVESKPVLPRELLLFLR